MNFSLQNEYVGKLNSLACKIVRQIDKGYDMEKICHKTNADKEFVEDVMRMYLTNPGVSIQGILDRIEIKNR